MPIKTIFKREGYPLEIRESVNNQPFPLKPSKVLKLFGLGVGSKTTLYKHEEKVGITPERQLFRNGSRLYNDEQILILARTFDHVDVCEAEGCVIVTGPTGNQAFLPKIRGH